MTAPMTDAEIREALARAERASAGPWLTGILDGPFNPETCAKYVEACLDRGALAEFWLVSCVKPDGVADVCHVGNGPTSPQNCDFLAHARTDVPRLAADLLAARAERDEARAFLRDFLHTTSGKRSLDGAPLSRLESAAQRLLSPQPPHTCQIHRATSGASDCGLSPCEEATVHRDRGAARPAENATPEAAKCATCGHEERRHLSEDGDGARWCDVALCDCVDYAALEVPRG